MKKIDKYNFYIYLLNKLVLLFYNTPAIILSTAVILESTNTPTMLRAIILFVFFCFFVVKFTHPLLC